MAGRVERRLRPAAAPGYWRRHVHKESVRNTGSPMAWAAMTNRTPARTGRAPWGGGEVRIDLDAFDEAFKKALAIHSRRYRLVVDHHILDKSFRRARGQRAGLSAASARIE